MLGGKGERPPPRLGLSGGRFRISMHSLSGNLQIPRDMSFWNAELDFLQQDFLGLRRHRIAAPKLAAPGFHEGDPSLKKAQLRVPQLLQLAQENKSNDLAA